MQGNLKIDPFESGYGADNSIKKTNISISDEMTLCGIFLSTENFKNNFEINPY